MSHSSKARLQFPFERIAWFLKLFGKYAERVGAGAPVYLAAVLEYLAPKIHELAGILAQDNKKNRVVTYHIQLLGTVTIANWGVFPNIHFVLLPNKPASASKAVVEEE
ncbi:hypothetical protein L7F22_041229 [Adiantum nelumboides]|nr:hypothetical protein [Adiantum nelumboides]